MLKQAILCHTSDSFPVFIEPITEEQEVRIDKSKIYYGEVRYIKDGLEIRQRDIYVYGEVDVNNDEDLDTIFKLNLIDEVGAIIPSRFNYERGTVIAEGNVIKTYTTFDAIDWFLYNHCRIGKPKRIIVYAKKPRKK